MVQAGYYTNNKKTWKFGVVTKKLRQLQNKETLDNGYAFKRHIKQLRKTGCQDINNEDIKNGAGAIKSLDGLLD
jgi:hypothetical protein